MFRYEGKMKQGHSLKRTTHLFLLVFLSCAFAFSFHVLTFAADINATITTGVFVPQRPTNLAVSIGDRSVDLSWSQPSSNGGSSITDYAIEYKLTSGGVWTEYVDGVSTDTFGTVLNLTNDTSYDFRVSAVNAIGQGLPSTEVSATPGAPAQILVTGFSDLSSPSIVTGIRITNEGGVAYEYQYTWCVTNSVVNLCGGGDDVFSSSAAKLIQPGENWDTSLSSTISSASSYWFHVQVHFGSDSSYANQSFVAVESSSGGGGGGGGGSSSGSRARSCIGGDINRDNIVNLIDFSIFLMSLNQPAPYPNPCVDVNRDGKVSVVDFSILLTQWGKKPVIYKKP